MKDKEFESLEKNLYLQLINEQELATAMLEARKIGETVVFEESFMKGIYEILQYIEGGDINNRIADRWVVTREMLSKKNLTKKDAFDLAKSNLYNAGYHIGDKSREGESFFYIVGEDGFEAARIVSTPLAEFEEKFDGHFFYMIPSVDQLYFYPAKGWKSKKKLMNFLAAQLFYKGDIYQLTPNLYEYKNGKVLRVI